MLNTECGNSFVGEICSPLSFLIFGFLISNFFRLTLKSYLKLMLFATGLCWLGFTIVLFYIDPEKTGDTGFALFYLSLLFALAGLIAVAGFMIRGRFSAAPLHHQVGMAFRQAIWFAGLIVFLLFLQGQRVLRWWNIILFIAFLAILEFLFISYRSSRGNQE